MPRFRVMLVLVDPANHQWFSVEKQLAVNNLGGAKSNGCGLTLAQFTLTIEQ